MSGGVPKRVKISRTQRNTFCKSGGWGQQGLILCGGQRGKQGMCNYIKKRTNLKEVLVPFEEEVEVDVSINVIDEINVTGHTDNGIDGLYTWYAFKNVGSGFSISFEHPTGTASNPFELEVFVVGGGGGGGGSAANAASFFQSNGAGGGGGGGQVNITTLTYTNGVTNIPITVGGGGAGGVVTTPNPVSVGTKASNGDNSSIGTIISKGGLGGTTTVAGQTTSGTGDIDSGGGSFVFNGSVSNNGGKGWINTTAVGGGGGGTLQAGGDYAGTPNPATGAAGNGGDGVNNASPGAAGTLVTSWSSILTAIGVPAVNGFGGGGGGGAAHASLAAASGGLGRDGGGNGTFAGNDGIAGGKTSSKTAAATNPNINTQVSLDGEANRGGGGGGSVSYAQEQFVNNPATLPPVFPWPNGANGQGANINGNFTPVDRGLAAGPPPVIPPVEAGGKGGSGLVIFRFLTAATVDLTKTRTLQRKPCADGLNK